jgi:hypothetical protein
MSYEMTKSGLLDCLLDGTGEFPIWMEPIISTYHINFILDRRGVARAQDDFIARERTLQKNFL